MPQNTEELCPCEMLDRRMNVRPPVKSWNFSVWRTEAAAQPTQLTPMEIPRVLTRWLEASLVTSCHIV